MLDLKVALLGCGHIAAKHLQYLGKRIPTERLALCDLNGRRLAWFGEEYGIQRLYEDFPTLLREFQPQVLHLTTPPQTHKTLGLAALEAGCHLFIEKPLAMSAKEAQVLHQEARIRQRLICVNHLRLRDPLVLKAKRLLASGRFGEVVALAVTQSDNYPERKRAGLAPAWMADLPGEIFFDLLPHHLSLVGLFLPQAALAGVVSRVDDGGELSDLLCTFTDGGRLAEIRMSVRAYPLVNQVLIHCQRGFLFIDFANHLLLARAKGNLPGILEQAGKNVQHGLQLALATPANMLKFLLGRHDSYRGMDHLIGDFYQAVVNQGGSPASGEEGPASMAMMDAIFRQVPWKAPRKKASRPARLAPAETLVTGGTGFVGQPLVQRLVEQGQLLRVLVRRPPEEVLLRRFPPDQVTFVQADLTNLEEVAKACQGIKTVYHLAAATRGNWLAHLDATVTGTANILAACQRMGVEHLVYVSTLSLLDQGRYPRETPINEEFPYDPHPEKRGNYTHSKLLAEKLVLDYLGQPHQMTVAVARVGLVYGPGKEFLAGLGMTLGNFLVVFGSGHRLVPLVQVENVADALLMLGSARREGVYNVVDQEKVTVKAAIAAYRDLTGEKVYPLYLPKPLLLALGGMADGLFAVFHGKSPGLAYKFRAACHGAVHDTSRIQQEIGWRSRLPFSAGLRRAMGR